MYINFYTSSSSISEKLIQLSNPTRIRFSLCIYNSYKQSQLISVPTPGKKTKLSNQHQNQHKIKAFREQQMVFYPKVQTEIKN